MEKMTRLDELLKLLSSLTALRTTGFNCNEEITKTLKAIEEELKLS